ncbi:MAG: hypothetical protein NW206_13250 [Hyphomonadaceae bacterium]|nr:hypothetical protein [Hyphomonadaceae bacterium]
MWRYLGLVLLTMVGVIIVMGVLRFLFGPELVGLIWLVLLVVGVVVIVRNFASNRKVADAAPEARAQALSFAADPSRATLYVLRTQFLGMAVGVNVEVDGKPVAQLKSPRFTRVLLTPGAHRVSGYTGPASGRKPGGELDLNAAPGEIIVVMCEVQPGMVGTTSMFKRVDLETVRAKLQSTRMVAPDLVEV